MSKQILIKLESKSIRTSEIHRREVRKSGNGAVINFLKKHIGKEVIIIIPE